MRRPTNVDLELARLNELEAWKEQLDGVDPLKSIPALNQWKASVDDLLDERARGILRYLIARWETGRTVGLFLFAAFGITGAASFGTLWNQFNTKVAQVQTVVDTRLQKIVDDKLTDDNIITQTKNQIIQETKRTLGAQTFFGVTATLAQAKLFLELRQHQPSDSAQYNIKIEDTADLLRDIEWLMEAYIPSAKMPVDRQDALVYSANGLIDQSQGNYDEAERWFNRAIYTDELFPEAKVFLARLLIRRMVYLGGGKWSDEEKRKEASRLLEEAYRLDKTKRNLEVRRSYVQKLWADADFKGSIDVAERELNAKSDHPPAEMARLYYRQGIAYFFWSKDTTSPVERDERIAQGVQCMIDAYERNPEFLKALNNIIWFSTHLYDDNDTVVFWDNINVKYRDRIQKYIAYLEREPGVGGSPELLSTLAEAYLSTGHRKKAEEKIDAAIFEAERHGRGEAYVGNLKKYRDRIKGHGVG